MVMTTDQLLWRQKTYFRGVEWGGVGASSPSPSPPFIPSFLPSSTSEPVPSWKRSVRTQLLASHFPSDWTKTRRRCWRFSAVCTDLCSHCWMSITLTLYVASVLVWLARSQTNIESLQFDLLCGVFNMAVSLTVLSALVFLFGKSKFGSLI